MHMYSHTVRVKKSLGFHRKKGLIFSLRNKFFFFLFSLLFNYIIMCRAILMHELYSNL